MKKICVYCGSSPGLLPDYGEAATALGEALAARNIGLVYGGASVGLMGTIADTVIAAGGEVIGVIPRSLVEKEVSHAGLTELRVVESMHERKAVMAEISDGFIAMPGGFGTLEEIFEVLTWSQLGFHRKPCALLNIQHYFDSLVTFMDHAVDQQFVRSAHRNVLAVAEEPDTLLDQMLDFTPPDSDKWIGRK